MSIERGGPSEEEMSFKAEEHEVAETVPSPEEIANVFKELGLENYTEKRKLEDDKGLYMWEVEVPGDAPGIVKEYEYMRKGHYGDAGSTHGDMGTTHTEINVTYYEDGVPYNGTTAAKYENGKWRIIE